MYVLRFQTSSHLFELELRTYFEQERSPRFVHSDLEMFKSYKESRGTPEKVNADNGPVSRNSRLLECNMYRCILLDTKLQQLGSQSTQVLIK